MRNILFIISLLFLSLSLFALDPYVEKQIDKGVNLALSGLIEPSFEVLSYEEKEADGRATISIELKIDEKTYHVVVADKNIKKARGRIDEEVKRSLKYISSLSSHLILDYEFDTSFSSVNAEQLKNGKTFLAKGYDDKKYGLLVVHNEKGNDEVTTYDVLFNKGIKPGLALEKTGANLLSFSFGINKDLCYNLSLDYKNFALIYPFSPLAGFSVTSIGSVYRYLFKLGLDYTLPLSTFFTTQFTLLQDANVSSSLSLVLGTEGRSFLLGAQLDLAYNWMLSSAWFISLGFSDLVLSSSVNDYKLESSTSYITLKGGVRF